MKELFQYNSRVLILRGPLPETPCDRNSNQDTDESCYTDADADAYSDAPVLLG